MFPSECPHHAHSCCILLHDRGKFSLCLVRSGKPLGYQPVKHSGVHHNNRHEQENDAGKLHIHGKHHDKRRKHKKGRAEHLQKLGNHKSAYHLHIRSTPLDNIPCLVPVMPSYGKLLHMDK